VGQLDSWGGYRYSIKRGGLGANYVAVAQQTAPHSRCAARSGHSDELTERVAALGFSFGPFMSGAIWHLHETLVLVLKDL
jgi:hypothetical protein